MPLMISNLISILIQNFQNKHGSVIYDKTEWTFVYVARVERTCFQFVLTFWELNLHFGVCLIHYNISFIVRDTF